MLLFRVQEKSLGNSFLQRKNSNVFIGASSRKTDSAQPIHHLGVNFLVVRAGSPRLLLNAKEVCTFFVTIRLRWIACTNCYLSMARQDLAKAKDAKKDEFYTQLPDIEKELMHYKSYFRDKVVFCNCDDPYESNFFKYFALNFNALRLKKLMATCYNGSPVSGNELLLDFGDTVDDPKKVAYKVEISEVTDCNGDGAVDLYDIQYLMQNDKNVISILKGNGDFRSAECVALLQEADIVVTNPPFSLFREYVAQLMAYDKRFIILGNMNAITYKEIFSLIKENKMWIGYGFNLSMIFKTTYPNLLEANRQYVRSKGFDPDKNFVKTPAIAWFTNVDTKKRHEDLILYKRYSPEEYPKYDNYDAINVDKVSDIPCDYDGAIGVPITFLDKYNPAQFEIIGLGISNSGLECGVRPYKPEHKKYRKEVQQRGAVDGDLYMMKDGVVEVPYARILIHRRQ